MLRAAAQDAPKSFALYHSRAPRLGAHREDFAWRTIPAGSDESRTKSEPFRRSRLLSCAVNEIRTFRWCGLGFLDTPFMNLSP
jgi:hypothetical protein